MRRFIFAVVFVILGGLLFFALRKAGVVGGPSTLSDGSSVSGAASGPGSAGKGANGKAAVSPPEERSTLADALNAPGGTLAKDLEIVHEVLVAWQTNFHHQGNPVGNNVEITEALTGKNKFALALIPRDHKAINSSGELCDRWGTPFRFHALSGTQMEIGSAGPDRKFNTPDDVTFSPWLRNALE